MEKKVEPGTYVRRQRGEIKSHDYHLRTYPTLWAAVESLAKKHRRRPVDMIELILEDGINSGEYGKPTITRKRKKATTGAKRGPRAKTDINVEQVEPLD